MPKTQLNIRISGPGRDKLHALVRLYGSQTIVIEMAIDRLYQQEVIMDTIDDLQVLTGHESGAIQYSDGTTIITNWVGITGIPRQFALGTVGLGEKLTAKLIAPPEDIIEAMKQHDIDDDCDPLEDGYQAWEVNDVIVVTNDGWT